MSHNREEVYAETTLDRLIAAHKEMRFAIDQVEDDDEIDRISGTMAAIEAEIAACMPHSKADAISQIEWLAELFPESSVPQSENVENRVLSRTLARLIEWARALP